MTERQKYSKDFGKKERVLNFACQTYQLSRPNKVGAVMALIRECQPQSFDEWKNWYFENAQTTAKTPSKVTAQSLADLGERLYEKIVGTVIPEWTEVFSALTKQDCVDYIFNLTINRTYDGFLREKSVVNDNLAKIFRDVKIEESSPELDHAGDVDYVIKIDETKQIGIQIKPVTAAINFGSYSLPERMKASFADFTEKYHGKFFLVFSVDDKIYNEDVIDKIREEITRLKSLKGI